MKHIKRFATLWFIMGMVYFTLEGFWRGWTNIAMLFIGGACGVLIGLLNQSKRHKQLRIYQQSLIGTFIILTVEFLTGCIFNLWLGWNLWSYAGLPGDLYGQICLPYAGLWFLLTPFAIWLDDWLRWRLYKQGRPYKLKRVYWKLVTLQ